MAKSSSKNLKESWSKKTSLSLSLPIWYDISRISSRTMLNLHMTSSSPLEFLWILCLRSHADAKAYDRNGRITALVKLGQRPGDRGWEGWTTLTVEIVKVVPKKNAESKKASRILQYQVFYFLWNLSKYILPRCFPTWKDRRCKRCRGCCRRRGWMPEFRHAQNHSAPKFKDHEIDLP